MRAACVFLGWAFVATIVWLSLGPSAPTIDVEQGDKLGHALAYAGTMFWFGQLYVRTSARLGYAIAFIALGVALEFVQAHVGRDFEVADMAADAVGVILGWAGTTLLRLGIPVD